MCTCCITWWPCRPAFYWIVHSRHSWAVVGYVTGWAHAFLSVCGGVRRGTTGAPSKLRSALSTLLLPRGCDPCAPPYPPMSPLLFCFFPLLLSRSLSGKKALLVTLWPKCTVLLMPVCLSWSHSSAAQGFVDVQMICSGFAATLHRPPSSCCLSLHNVWLCLLYLFLLILPALMRISEKEF